MTDTIIRFTADGVYQYKLAPYDAEYPKHSYLIPVMDDDGDLVVVDCLLTDKEGEICPGYSNVAVPIRVGDIGGMVKHFGRFNAGG